MDNNWRYNTISVTKYDPAFRDDKGVYTHDEWTSYYDIGNVFGGVMFNESDFFLVEDKYIKAIELFLTSTGCTNFSVNSLEKYDEDGLDDDMLAIYHNIENGQKLSLNEVLVLARLILRAFIWCEIFCNEYVVRFGYDFYMYFNAPVFNEDIFQKIKELGLFVEK